ncbi:glycosyltransferase family 2 protein [Salinirubrum litoreum]|uniref:Glycosyltransferase family 2 protein n=1 Tax=Salinirubrum litoreum TaxID=1126234 RepID=A0ABD5RCF7_9EURY|nr:glycosyltransferase family 2 protein [Salinirubrum litoreum]
MVLVSVVIPTYNRADVLPRAVETALDQTLTDIEVIVVDDASTDETLAVLEEYDDPRLTVLEHETNSGASAARNTGIAVAEGDYVALLDSDDEWAPEKLERQVETVATRSDEWVAAYCGTTVVTDESAHPVVQRLTDLLGRQGNADRVEGGEKLVREVLCQRLHTSAGSTLLVDADVVDRIGGFDESFDRYQDTEFLIRVLKEGKLAYVDEPLLRRYPSGGPAAAAVRDANCHLLKTFAEDVVEYETRGHDVTGANQYTLARLFFAEGKFSEGIDHLKAGTVPEPRQLPGLAYTVYSGLKA